MNDTEEDTRIGTSAFNSNNNDAKYVGYMYGGEEGEASTQRNGLISAAATYNETSSTIKGILDTWYKTNIFDQGLESQVANNLFCNDRQLVSEVGGGTTGLGYGTLTTFYAPRHRLLTTKTPTLKCGLPNDRFTTSADIVLGNKVLTHPLGLITADEASMAGLLRGTSNVTNYLYTNYSWWLLSPADMYTTIAEVWVTGANGLLSYSNVNSIRGSRPVISLSSSVEVTGTGSATDPFIASK